MDIDRYLYDKQRRAEIARMREHIKRLEADKAELLEACEFALEPLRNYFDAMAKQLELRKLIKDNPFPEYSIVQLDITKKAISLIDAAIAKVKRG